MRRTITRAQSGAALLLLVLALASCGRALKAPAELGGNIRVHDPSLIKEGEAYYLFSTGDEHGLNGGTIQIRRSTDLAEWELVGTVFDSIPAWVTDELDGTPPNLWAPDIAHFNGKYRLYYAGSRFGTNNSVIGLATNATLDPDSPDYKWVDEGMVTRSRPSYNWNAIDPNVSFDADGAPWLSLGSFWDGIKMLRLDLGTGTRAEADTTLYALASRGGGPIEAPAIVYREGYYYLFVSFDFCCRGVNSTYKIMVGRSERITGPYVDRAGERMDHGAGTLLLDGKEPYLGPGGQAVYLDNGTYRLVHHYYDKRDNGAPKLQIHDLEWASDGWPAIADH